MNDFLIRGEKALYCKEFYFVCEGRIYERFAPQMRSRSLKPIDKVYKPKENPQSKENNAKH